MASLRTVFAAALLLAGAGCAEEPQTLQSAAEAPSRSESWQAQHRERTLRQDESVRIYR